MNPDAKDFCPSWQTATDPDETVDDADSDDGFFWQPSDSAIAVAAPSRADQIGMLANIFPEFSLESLESFLSAHDNDLMVCVESLLSLRDASDSDPVPNTEPKPSSKPVCKYFLNGHCLIANCQFLHSRTDRSAICSFWLKGHCARGSDCNFLHELDCVTTTVARPSSSSVVADTRSVQPAVPTPIGPSQPAPFDLVARFKLESLQTQWSQVNPSVVEDCFRTAGKNLASVTEGILRTRFGPPANGGAGPRAAAIRPPPLRTPSRPVPAPSLPTSTPIVATGATINDIYMQKRDAAMEHARQRNAFFTAATAAFMRGDGALAKELSRKGRYHHDMMEQLHQEASGEIFETRNRHLKAPKRQGHVIDVHGLHADEAVDRVSDELKRLCSEFGRRQAQSRQGRWLDVITGVGRHSHSGSGKVRPAVMEYARHAGFNFQEMSIAGSIRIYF